MTKLVKNKPTRVLHAVTIMDRAGLETMLMNYYRNIDRTKVQFDFLTHRKEEGQYDKEIRKLGGKIYHVPPISLAHPIKYINALDSFFKKHNEYKIVHSHLDAFSAFPLSVAKKYKIPVRIAHSHVNKFDFDIKLPVRCIARFFIPRYATDFFACSDEASKFMFGNREHHIIYNAIDLKRFKFNPATRKDTRRRLGIAEDSLVVGHVGRFDKVKNHSFLIDIFTEFLREAPNAILLLVGEGILKDKIRKKVDALGLDSSVKFLGSRDDVPELMQAMDTFVMPSKYEGLGISLVEAQASGLYCLASDGLVPSGVKLANGFDFIKLDAGASVWADHIKQFKNKKRSSSLINIRKSGYNIMSSGKSIQDLYLKNKLKKILVIGMSSKKGGVESFIMNYYHHIDREKIQFDFLVYDILPAYSEEINKLGGKIHILTGRRANFFRHIK